LSQGQDRLELFLRECDVSHQNGKKIGILAVVTSQPTFDVSATDTTPGTNAVYMMGPNTSGTAVFVPNSTQQQWQYQTTSVKSSASNISNHIT